MHIKIHKILLQLKIENFIMYHNIYGSKKFQKIV